MSIRNKKVYGKEKKETSTAKIAIWYVISNVFVTAVSFFSTPIFSRIMSKTEYGNYSNFLSWTGIIEIFATLNIAKAIARAKYEFDDEMDDYITSILIFSNIVTVILYMIIEVNKNYFQTLFSMDIIFIRIMFVYLFFYTAFSYLQIKHRVYQKYKFFVAFSLGSSIIRTITALILVLKWEDRLFARVVGDIIPITILNLGLWFMILGKGKKIRSKFVKFSLAISVPLIPHTLAGNILTHADKIMITNICSSEETALYSLAYSISSAASMLWNAMNQAWSPWLFDNMAVNNKESIRKNSKVYLGVFAILIIGILLLAPEVILIMGGEAYYETRFVMPPVILACVMQFVYGMYVNIEIFTKKTFQISVGTVLAGGVNILLNYLFIPRFGYMAAAYTTLAGYALLLIFHYLLVQKGKQYTDIYDTKFIVMMIVILLMIGMFTLVLYNYNSVRYILILIYGVILLSGLVYFRKTIISFFK